MYLMTHIKAVETGLVSTVYRMLASIVFNNNKQLEETKKKNIAQSWTTRHGNLYQQLLTKCISSTVRLKVAGSKGRRKIKVTSCSRGWTLNQTHGLYNHASISVIQSPHWPQDRYSYVTTLVAQVSEPVSWKQLLIQSRREEQTVHRLLKECFHKTASRGSRLLHRHKQRGGSR